ncbi:MAG: hypothetical protein ACYCPQ_06490 [Elusimicrobiota bacterium]
MRTTAALAWACLTLAAGPAQAAVLTDSTAAITSEVYASGGAASAASANFKTLADIGDVIGLANSADYMTGAGFVYTLFGGALFPAAGTSSIGSSGGTVVYQGPSGPASVQIPPNAYGSTVTVSITAPPTFSCGPSPVENLVPITQSGGVGIDVGVAVEPQESVVVSISYQNAALAGGLDPRGFVIARCDPNKDVWVPLPTNLDALGKSAAATSDHLSLFQIMSGAAPAGVSGFKAWPDPLRPSLGETQMNFLAPANSRIRIYTLSGLLVRDLTADSNGTAVWDGNNQSGRPAASGVYFVFAQGAGQEKTIKVAVQR